MKASQTVSLVTLMGGACLFAGGLLAQNKATLKEGKALPGSNPQAQARIVREVRHELATQALYGVFDNLTFDVNDSTVILKGYVTNIVLKSNAEKAVKEIEGVEEVENQIEVAPVLDSDAAIRIATYRAIYGAPSLERYALQAIPSIHIIVNRGNVTLEGVVLNQADADQALIRAKTVPGTFEVKSNLRVDSPAQK